MRENVASAVGNLMHEACVTNENVVQPGLIDVSTSPPIAGVAYGVGRQTTVDRKRKDMLGILIPGEGGLAAVGACLV